MSTYDDDFYKSFRKMQKEGHRSEASMRYDAMMQKDTAKLDTFDADLKSATDLLNKVYGGWQSADDMKSAYDTVSSMRNRLNAHKGYTNYTYSNQDLADYNTNIDKYITAYDSALENWGALSSEYGKYKDADSWGVARKNTELYNKYKGLDYEGVKKAREENPDDAEFLSRYGTNVGFSSKEDVKAEIRNVDYLIQNATGAERDSLKYYRNTLYERLNNPNAPFKGSEAFSDGWQPGDLLDALGSTAVDAVVKGSKGVLGALEGLGDFATYGTAWLTDIVGADAAAEYLRDLAKQNMTRNLYLPYEGSGIQQDSFLGGFGGAVAEGMGQMGFNMLTAGMGHGAGMGKVGSEVFSKGALFASAAGNATSEAYESGATDTEALLYGLLSGTVETGSEMMFGGFGKGVNSLGLSHGLGQYDDILAKKLGSKINNFVLRNAAEFGVKATGEGFEEVVAGIGNAAAKKLTYMSEEDIWKLIDDEELLNSFLVGTVSSAFTQTPSLMSSYKYGTDYITNRNGLEEAYISTEVEKRIAEAEKDGKKLSNSERNKLYAQVEKELTTKQNEAREKYKRSAPESVSNMANFDTSDSVDISTGNTIKIQGIRSDSGNTVLKTNMGDRTLDSVTLNRRDADLVAVAEGMDDDTANTFVSLYNGGDVNAYRASFDLVRSYGNAAFGAENSVARRGVLTEEQAIKIYEYGISERTSVPQKKLDEITEKHFADGGKILEGTFDDSAVHYEKLNSRQKASISFLKMLSKATGMNVKIFESAVDKDGNREAKQGYYEPSTNTIHIDAYAGMDKDLFDDAIIPVMAHEVTHWMQYKAPDAYAKMSGIIMDTLSRELGVFPEQLVAREKKRLQKNGHGDVTDEYAQDEIVARACEDMLSGNRTVGEIIENMDEQTAKTFSEKFKEVVSKIRAWIKDLLKTYKSNSEEAKILRKYDDKLAELQKAWDEGFAQAIRTNQAVKHESVENVAAEEKKVNEQTEKVGVSVDMETKSAYPSDRLSERTWSQSEYVQNRKVAVSALVKALGVTEAEASKYVDDINSIARMIADDRARLDYEPNLDDNASVFKPNSDYKWTIDMSTLCAKRLLFTGTFDKIQKKLKNTAFASEDIVRLREMMMAKGYEVACGICYVESTRRELGPITQDFIERYKLSQKTGKPITRVNSKGKAVDLVKTKDQMKTTVDKANSKFYADKNYTPTLGELNTTDIDKVKVEHPLVYEAYLNYMNARGQAKPKLLETRAEYKGEIAKKYARTKDGKVNKSVESMNAAGGLRLQSFSDFEVAHLIDMMQIVLDMSSVGLKSQAYTKVPEFAEVFGDTGVKINLSLIAKDSGLDENGNLIFDDVEGIDHEKAFKLREKFSKNVGTILVGKNKAHIIAAMADDRIDYIIPFHKSSWKESLYDSLGLTGYEDFTDTQHEKPIDADREIKDFQPSEYWDYGKTGDENAQIYLEKCKEDGRIPKFPEFSIYPGYWKLLIDFKMYDNDGVGSKQTEVRPKFNMEAAERILNEYKGGHRALPVAEDVVEEFVEEYENANPNVRYSERVQYVEDVTQMMTGKNWADVNRVAYENVRGEANIVPRAICGDFIIPSGEDLVYTKLNSKNPEDIEINQIVNVKVDEDSEFEDTYHQFAFDAFRKGYEDGRYENTSLTEYAKFVEHNVSEMFGRTYSIAVYARQNYQSNRKNGLAGEETKSRRASYNFGNEQNGRGNSSTSTGNLSRFSTRDSEGNGLTKEQIEFFKNSKLRDENGNLKVMYHGTSNASFTVFNPQYSDDGTSLFFTDSKTVAKGYSGTMDEYIPGKKYTVKELTDIINDSYLYVTEEDGKYHIVRNKYGDLVKEYTADTLEEMQSYVLEEYGSTGAGNYKVYLNLTNPLIVDANGRYWDELEGIGDAEGTTRGYAEYATANGYDGVIILNVVDTAIYASGSERFESSTVAIAFSSEQVKSVANENPTADPDIRYSERGVDSWLDSLDIDDILDDITGYIFKDSDKKERASRRVDEVNKRLKTIGLSFNGTKSLAWTDERIEKYLGGGWYGSSNPEYAQAYIAYVTPQQFLNLTAGSNTATLDRIENENKEYGELDISKLGEVPMFLDIHEGMNGAKVTGHEGRHRMYLLGKAGFEKVPVLLFDYRTKYDKTAKDSLKLTAQRFNDKDFISKTRDVVLTDVIPFSNGNKELIIKKFGSGAEADVHYSERQTESIYDAVGELRRLQKENEVLKKDIERLKRFNKLERTVTGGILPNESQIKSVAAFILKNADSRYDKNLLADELREIYSYMQTEDVEWNIAMSKMLDLARSVVEAKTERKIENDYAKFILSTIRGTKVSFNDTQKAEAENVFGKNWNRNYFGWVTVANDGVPLESVWSEWSNQFPDVFSADISDADMATALVDIYDSTKSASEIVEEYDKAEMARDIAFEMYNQLWNVTPLKTLADKHDKEVKRLKFEHRQEMKELREKTDKQVFETKWHYSKLIHEVREARDKKIANIKKESREYTKEYREKLERRSQISQITKKSLKLNKWLKNNSKDEHIVEDLKAPVAAVLRALDFSSERFLGTGVPTQKDISLKKAFAHLYDSLDEIYKNQGEDNYSIDMPVDYVEFVKGVKKEVDEIVEKVGDNENILRDMTLEQLQDVNKMLSVLTHIVTSANKALADANGKAISTMAQSTMQYADSLGLKSKKVGAFSDFFNFDNGLPVYVFKMMGSGGQQIFRNMQDGWDKMAFHVKRIKDYADACYKAKEVKEWSKEVHDFTFDDGSEVKMTTAQIMSLYCLQKRDQARQHLVQGGMRVADFKVGTNKITNEGGALLLPHEIDMVTSKLTARQKEVADSLQRFMNTVCSDWGNEVSMRRFGIKSFGEENYFPIKSDVSVLPGDDTPKADRGSEVFRLLNMDFTKTPNPKADNRIMVDNIFDVFATHTSDMAKYNALALPVLDMCRWYNYKESYRINPSNPEDLRKKTKALKQSLKTAYGEGSTSYIMQFMKDINGAHSGGMSNMERWNRKLISNYKIAAVGANLRVAILQPTSYMRASAVISPKYLTAALAHKPQVNKAKTTCGIALWKSLGFYDTNISRGVTDLIKHNDGWYQKTKEISMKLAEWGDAATWGYLYNACEAEIKDLHPELTGKAKDDAVALRLRDVIYATQVVDSTMTRTQNMRNPNWINQAMTAFMSEPSISYNMLHDLYIQYNADKRQLGSKSAAFKKSGKKIARVTASYFVTLCCASLAGGVIDAARDDDDEKDFIEKIFSNATENAISDMLGMLPGIKDVVSIYKGFNVGRMDMQGIQSTYYATQKLYKAIMKGEWDYKTVCSLIKSCTKAFSQNSGIPLYNAMRDAIAIWNNTVGEMYESLKLK